MSHGRLPSVGLDGKHSSNAVPKQELKSPTQTSTIPYIQNSNAPWSQNVQENDPLSPECYPPWPVPPNPHNVTPSQSYPDSPQASATYTVTSTPASAANIVHREIRDISFPITGKMAMAMTCLQQMKQPSYISINTDDKPQCLQDALTRYIDYLLQENEIKTSLSLAKFPQMPCQLERERYFYDALQNSVSFPTPKFKEWIKLYGMDIEVGEATEENNAAAQNQPNVELHANVQSKQVKHRPYDVKSRPRTPKKVMRERLGLPNSPGFSHLLNQISEIPVHGNTSVSHDHFLQLLEHSQEKAGQEEDSRKADGNTSPSSLEVFSPTARKRFNLVNSPKPEKCKIVNICMKPSEGENASHDCKNIRV